MKFEIFDYNSNRNIPSLKIYTERNASGSRSSGLNLGEDGGDWLGGFKYSREETRFSSSWSREMRIKFDSLGGLCVLI